MSDPSPIFEITHRLGAELDYGFDWNARGWLDQSPGDTIGDGTAGSTAPVWTLTNEATGAADPGTEIFDQDAVGAVTTAWVRGLADDTDYILKCVVTLTPSGRKDARTMRLRCRKA